MSGMASATYQLVPKQWGATLFETHTEKPVAIINAMPLETMSDEELVSRYNLISDAQEREGLVNELFRRNYSRVARWCLRFQSDRELAADLAQEIFTKAYQNLKSFQAQSKFSTWLFVIARNHCLNAVRANAREASELKADVDEDFLAAIPDSGSGAHAELERASSRKLV